MLNDDDDGDDDGEDDPWDEDVVDGDDDEWNNVMEYLQSDQRVAAC